MKDKKTFFCSRLKKIMFDKNITQQQLADKLNVAQTIISRWVRGNFNPNMNSVKKLATALDVPVSYFMEDEKNGIKNSEDNNNNNLVIDLIKQQNEKFEEKLKRYDMEFILMRKEIEELKETLINSKRKP